MNVDLKTDAKGRFESVTATQGEGERTFVAARRGDGKIAFVIADKGATAGELLSLANVLISIAERVSYEDEQREDDLLVAQAEGTA